MRECQSARGMEKAYLEGDRENLHVLLVQHGGQRAHELAHVHHDAPWLPAARLHCAAAARDGVGGRHHPRNRLLHARLQDSLPRLRPQQR